MSMINYVVQNKNGDANRVYVAGHSSGGMMTNILVGSYPDVFKAGAAYAGVAFACFATGPVDSLGWNSNCATGKVTMTGAQWGNLVRAADPGFSGTRPRMQLWHGTVDATVNFTNFGEEIKEWTNVLGVSATPTSTENNALQSTWIRTRYTDSAGVVQVEAIQETGQPHNLVVNAAEAIRFFGLDGSNPVSVPDAGATVDARRDVGATVTDASSSPDVRRMGTGGMLGSIGGAVGTGGIAGTGGVAGTSSGSGGDRGGSAAGGGSPTNGPGTPPTGTGGGPSAGSTSGDGATSGCACAWTGHDDTGRSPAAMLALIVGLLLLRRRRGGGRY
jgi:MYXO-CTERM domain-containing protein